MNQPTYSSTMQQPQTPHSDDPHPVAPKPAQSFLGQAQHWLTEGNLGERLGQLSPAVKHLGDDLTARYHKLSTTQKVVGGALLFLGVRQLLRGSSKKHGYKHRDNRDAESDTLRELLQFVNDRGEGYKKAVEESQDPQLRGYYQELVGQSRQFASRLNTYLHRQGAEPQTGTTLKGKLYRRFMEAAATLTGHDEKAILASNVHGEQWALKAYEDALGSDSLRGEMRQAVARQRADSDATLRRLKQLTAQQ